MILCLNRTCHALALVLEAMNNRITIPTIARFAVFVELLATTKIVHLSEQSYGLPSVPAQKPGASLA